MISRFLSFPRVAFLAIFLALLLSALQLFHCRFVADDLIHAAVLERALPMPSPGPLDLYRFINGKPQDIQISKDLGLLPWFAHPELKIAFWRPLSSALIALDHSIFGLHPLGYRIHSLLWYGALVFVLGLVLQRFAPGPAGGLALILFALAGCHRQPVCWISSRFSLIAATVGLFSLYAHIRWREDGWRAGRVLSMIAFPAALLAGEAAISSLAYFVAYESIAAPGGWKMRWKAIWPIFVLAVLWLSAYFFLGYGVRGSGGYFNPLEEPFTYLFTLLPRSLILAGNLFIWFFNPLPRTVAVLVGLGAILLLAALFPSLWRGLSKKERGSILWLGLGAAGSVLPQTPGLLGTRSIMYPSVGGSALIAFFLVHWWRTCRRSRGLAARLHGLPVAVLALLHLILAPFSWFFWTHTYKKEYERNEALLHEAEFDDELLSKEKVVFLNSPNESLGVYAYFQRAIDGKPLPKTWWVISMARCDHRVRRTGPDTLELERVCGRFLQSSSELLFRSRKHPLSEGDSVLMQGLRATVLAAGEGGPSRIELKFDQSLEDPSLLFMAWNENRLRHIQPPPVGQSILLPWKSIPTSLK